MASGNASQRLTVTAEILKFSPQSVMRDWKLAKAWLTRELTSH